MSERLHAASMYVKIGGSIRKQAAESEKFENISSQFIDEDSTESVAEFIESLSAGPIPLSIVDTLFLIGPRQTEIAKFKEIPR